jgi:phosphoribosylformylglycinamidine (FGAM) synthase-like enzyme
VAVAEMAIAGRLGASISPSTIHHDIVAALFSESTGRIVCEVEPRNVAQFVEAINVASDTNLAVVIGSVSADHNVHFGSQLNITVAQLVHAFNRTTA